MIAVCIKWVDARAEVDPLSGAVAVDRRRGGASEADGAALEWALQLAEVWNTNVVVATAGPATTEPMLRDALAAGAAQAIRVELPEGAASELVAAALAAALPADATTVVCGAWSIDRGSGSVPAYLAARRQCAQALGLLTLTFDGTAGVVNAERRLDGGRRERVRASGPMVLSVEGGARLRRASLDAVLRAQQSPVEVIPTPVALVGATHRRPPTRTTPFRPRPRSLPAPSSELSARQRILSLTGALVDRVPPRLVHLEPAAAAAELLAQLETWGYR